MDIVNSVMKQPKDVLSEAQSSFNACSQLVSAVETIAQFTSAFQAQKVIKYTSSLWIIYSLLS